MNTSLTVICEEIGAPVEQQHDYYQYLCTGFVCVLSQPSALQLGLGTRFYFVAILNTLGIRTMMALEYVSLNFVFVL